MRPSNWTLALTAQGIERRLDIMFCLSNERGVHHPLDTRVLREGVAGFDIMHNPFTFEFTLVPTPPGIPIATSKY